jgi:hypothetical protein
MLGSQHDWKIEEAKRQLETRAKPHDIMRNYEQKKSRYHRDIEYFYLYSAFTIALGDFLKESYAQLSIEYEEDFLNQTKLTLGCQALVNSNVNDRIFALF